MRNVARLFDKLHYTVLHVPNSCPPLLFVAFLFLKTMYSRMTNQPYCGLDMPSVLKVYSYNSLIITDPVLHSASNEKTTNWNSPKL